MMRILYCHCAYARIVPAETKDAVLEGLARAGVEFDAVPDLCEMAARRDPRLGDLAGQAGPAPAPLRIAACYPRAVKWLFASAGVNIDESRVRILNMRIEAPARVLENLLSGTPGGPASLEGDAPAAGASSADRAQGHDQ